MAGTDDPALPVFGNQEGTGLETHLFRHLLSLSIIVFSANKRTKRWETVGMNSLGIPQDRINRINGIWVGFVLGTDHGYPVQGHMFFLSNQGQMDSCGFINLFDLIFLKRADEFH